MTKAASFWPRCIKLEHAWSHKASR
jgi:hypothetical protein